MLPRALAGASHDEKVAAAHVESQGASAAGGTQEEAPPGPEPRDRDDGVAARGPEPVAVKSHAVAAIPVGGERDPVKGAPVVSGECGGQTRDQRMAGAILGQARNEARHVHDPLVHAPTMRLPARCAPERVQYLLVPPHPFGEVIDPGTAAQIGPREPSQRGVEGGLLGKEQSLAGHGRRA